MFIHKVTIFCGITKEIERARYEIYFRSRGTVKARQSDQIRKCQIENVLTTSESRELNRYFQSLCL